MKKIAMLLMAMIMVMVMLYTIPTTVQAEDAKLTASDASAERSQMVYLNVSIEGCDKANTLGISIEYDSDVLKKVVSECTWTNKGILQDFDVAKDNGVWATDKAKDLNGGICTLAFRVKANAPVGDTKVSCTLIVKNDSTVVGTYTAESTVSVTCEHVYGEWSQKNENTHSKVCKYCQYEKTEAHQWDEGIVTKQPTKNEGGKKLYTCVVCGGSKQVAISAGGDTGSEETESSAQIPKEDDEKQNANGSKPTVSADETTAATEKPTVPVSETTATTEKPSVPAGETTTNGQSSRSEQESLNSDANRGSISEAASASESSEENIQSVMESDNSDSEAAAEQESNSAELQQEETLEQGSSKVENSTYYLVGGIGIVAVGVGILMVKRRKGKR